jgi:fatty-acyl-CoA synthase
MIKPMNIAWWVKRWSELRPDKPAILFDGQPISYLELHFRAVRTICWLQSLGIGKGDRVAVMLKNSPEFIELYLACSHLGAIFVPVNFHLVGQELDYILKNSEPSLFVFSNDYIEKAESLKPSQGKSNMLLASTGSHSVCPDSMDYNAETAAFEGKKPLLKKPSGLSDPEEPHIIMYTSGTTGQPKGAVLSHRKTFFNCLNADIFFELQTEDIMLIVLPLFHSGGLLIQTSPTLYKGATIVLHPKFDPPAVYQDINTLKVTKFCGVPTIYRALLTVESQKRSDLSSLKACGIGGERTTPELLAECKQAGFPVHQLMGQTETSIILCASEEDWSCKSGTVGRPVFHAEVCIVDEGGQPAKFGEIGEIVVRGPITMTEYWRDPAKTQETIKNGWLHTGDLARMDEEGYFYIVDRAKDMYISGGENVYPKEIELILREHPEIEDVAVVGVPDEIWGEVGQAFVIPKSGSGLCSKDLISYCDGRLARYKWPKEVIFCQAFPRTSLGKVRKSKLLEGNM